MGEDPGSKKIFNGGFFDGMKEAFVRRRWDCTVTILLKTEKEIFFPS